MPRCLALALGQAEYHLLSVPAVSDSGLDGSDVTTGSLAEGAHAVDAEIDTQLSSNVVGCLNSNMRGCYVNSNDLDLNKGLNVPGALEKDAIAGDFQTDADALSCS